MAWTASVTSKNWSEGILYVDITYTDGTRTVVEHHRIAGPVVSYWLERTAKDRLDRLTAIDAVNISLGPVGSPGTDPADTVFIGKLNKLLRVAQLINAGALVKTDSKVTALVSDVAASLTTYWDKL